MLRRFGLGQICVLLVLGAAVLAGCSSDGGSALPSGGGSDPCPLVARLDEIVASIRPEAVADPTAFKKTLDEAVGRYAETVRELREVVPADLHDGLERVEDDVLQYRFEDAIVHSASLDAYAQTECSRAASTTTVAVPTTTAA